MDDVLPAIGNRLWEDCGRTTYDLLSPDYNILQAIRNILINLPIRTDIAHIRGHQDRHKTWHELDNREQINVLANKQANAI